MCPNKRRYVTNVARGRLRPELHKIALFCAVRVCCGTPWKKSPITHNSSYKSPKRTTQNINFVQFVFYCVHHYSVHQCRCILRNGSDELLPCEYKFVCFAKRWAVFTLYTPLYLIATSAIPCWLGIFLCTTRAHKKRPSHRVFVALWVNSITRQKKTKKE